MSFKLEKWSTIGAQTKRGIAYQKFSYLDEDDGQDKIIDPGYFNDVKLNISEHDVIEVLDTTVTPAFVYFVRIKDAGGLYSDAIVEVVNQGGAGKDAVQNSTGSSNAGNIVAFTDNTGKQVADSGINAQDLSNKTTQAFDKANEVNAIATNAETSATNAVSKVNELYDEFANLKLWNKDSTYKKGNFVRVDAKPYSIIYVSAVENNLNNQPPLNPEHGSDAFWTYYSHEYTGKEEFSANVEEAELEADGSTTEFVLTDANVNLKPESNNQILGVFFKLPNETIKLISDKEYTVYRRADGKSVILFNQALPADSVPGTKNIIVKGADPKVIEVLHAVPVGGSMMFHTPVLPQGWLELDGSIVTKSAYPDLVLALTNNPNATQAVLDDMRGVVPRGWDNGRGLDPDRALGSYQDDAMQPITGSIDIQANYGNRIRTHSGIGALNSKGSGTTFNDGSNGTQNKTTGISFDSAKIVRTSNETRMKNNAVIFAVKAFDTVVNTGVVDLNGLTQIVNDLKANLHRPNAFNLQNEHMFNTNTLVHPMGYTWNGKVFGEGGSVLESSQKLHSGLIAINGFGAEVDYATNTVDCKNNRDNYLSFNMHRNYVNYTNKFTVKWSAKQGAFPAGIDVKAQLSMGLYRGNGGINGFVLGLFDDTKTLKLWATTNGSSWAYSGTSGTKQYDATTDYDYNMTHDIATGRLVISYSEDGKLDTDPSKTWVEDLIIENMTTPIYFNTYSVNAHHYIGNHPSSTTQIAPEKLYMDKFSLTVDDVDLYKAGTTCLYKERERASMYVGNDVNGEVVAEMVTDTTKLRKITGDKREVLAIFGGYNYQYGCYGFYPGTNSIKADNLVEATGFKHVECRLFQGSQGTETVKELFNDFSSFKGGVTLQSEHGSSKLVPHYMSQAHVVQNAGKGKDRNILMGKDQYMFFGLQTGSFGNSVLHTGAGTGLIVSELIGHVR
jgi:hypothetical protein